MRIRFWGTRGSIPKPGPATVRYGGNTSCVEVRADGTLIVLDCGTGAHELGQQLVAGNPGPMRGHLLITHTHWDHIQGFPFFAPLFVAGSEWDVYAPRQMGRTLEEILGGQMHRTYFPVPLGELAATIRYHELTEGVFDLDAVRVTTRYLNHPAPALGYRLESNGVVVVYATDHEPHSRHHPDATGDAARVHREDARHIEFLAGADLVIHDATYTLEEYPARLSWGHTPAEWAVDFAVAARARRLALFHHEPSRTDRAIDQLLAACRQRLPARDAPEIFAAAEGQYLVVVRPGAAPAASTPVVAVTAERAALRNKTTVLVADDDPDVMAVIVETLEPEGYRVLTASDGDAALQIARDERPDIVVLDWMMPGQDGLAVCRALRQEPDPKLAEVPVILITGRADAQDTAAGFNAGVTDYLTKPFKPTHLVARLQSWLIRSDS
ncbi:MAG TPA: response regulator [Candidatus Acidoferrum sp.]|jgi:CheY-like chemotaxis protein/phosphoribosyl 1,2-cyclic phosphodiesterase|nr:response regulator [Candidatus Acidoferrum sp.]